MLNEIQAVSPAGTSLTFTLGPMWINYLITNIDGLGPVHSKIVASEFARKDGSNFRSSYREARDIKFNIRLEPRVGSISVASLRNELANVFRPDLPVTLRFTDAGKVYEILGNTESIDVEMFSETPTAMVSVYCSNPNFKDTRSYRQGLSFGGTERIVDYRGNISAPVKMSINFYNTVSGFTLLTNRQGFPNEIFSIDYVFQAGDLLTMNSTVGSKSLILNRQGVESSLVYAITEKSVWPRLTPGKNTFKFDASTTGAASATFDWFEYFGGL